jgi:hypothetical protein
MALSGKETHFVPLTIVKKKQKKKRAGLYQPPACSFLLRLLFQRNKIIFEDISIAKIQFNKQNLNIKLQQIKFMQV